MQIANSITFIRPLDKICCWPYIKFRHVFIVLYLANGITVNYSKLKTDKLKTNKKLTVNIKINKIKPLETEVMH